MKKVLIVEDDPNWAMIVSSYVRQLELRCVVVQSPQQAMDVLDDEPVDLMVVDMMLAVETGMTLLNEIRGYKDLAAIPVMVFTNLDGITAPMLSQYGVDVLLNKSTATPEEVKHSMRELVYGRG